MRPRVLVFLGCWVIVSGSAVADAVASRRDKTDLGGDVNRNGGGLAMARSGGGMEEVSGSEVDICREKASACWTRRVTERQLRMIFIFGRRFDLKGLCSIMGINVNDEMRDWLIIVREWFGDFEIRRWKANYDHHVFYESSVDDNAN